jgi:hypothetical protein
VRSIVAICEMLTLGALLCSMLHCAYMHFSDSSLHMRWHEQCQSADLADNGTCHSSCCRAPGLLVTPGFVFVFQLAGPSIVMSEPHAKHPSWPQARAPSLVCMTRRFVLHAQRSHACRVLLMPALGTSWLLTPQYLSLPGALSASGPSAATETAAIRLLMSRSVLKQCDGLSGYCRCR